MTSEISIRNLRNIGPTIADRLETVGVKTAGDLKRIGPARAYNLVKLAYADLSIPVCYYLYSLRGALEEKHWDALPESTKNRLLREAGIERPTKSVRRLAVMATKASQGNKADLHRRKPIVPMAA